MPTLDGKGSGRQRLDKETNEEKSKEENSGKENNETVGTRKRRKKRVDGGRVTESTSV